MVLRIPESIFSRSYREWAQGRKAIGAVQWPVANGVASRHTPQVPYLTCAVVSCFTVAEVFLYFTDLCSLSLCRISVHCWQGLPIISENSQRYSHGHSCKRLCFFCSGLYQCLIPKKPLERGACMTAVASTFVQILKTSRFPGMLQNILNPGADIAQGREPDLRPTLCCCPVSFIILLKHLQKDQLSQYPPKTINQTN